MGHEEHLPATSAAAEASASEVRSAGPYRILLAEDDRSVRRYLEVILQRAGYQVISAADGLEAMKLALSSQVDAVIADSIMPHLSGQELCRLLRSNPKVSRLPIVLLTALENKGTVNPQDFQLDACLYKPVSAEELTACLARLLEHRE
jgi:DNA-binding response OmpR family regulator